VNDPHQPVAGTGLPFEEPRPATRLHVIVMPLGHVYLVNLVHTMDDIPMRLFADMDEAFEFAKQIAWDVPEEMSQRLELPGCSTPVCVSVTTFQDGIPISRVVVRDFEDEA